MRAGLDAAMTGRPLGPGSQGIGEPSDDFYYATS